MRAKSSATETPVRGVDEQEVKIGIGVASMGNALECFDFGVYS